MKPILQESVTATTGGAASDVSGDVLSWIEFYVCRVHNTGAQTVAINEPGMAAASTSGVMLASGASSPLMGPYRRALLDGTGTNSLRLTTASSTSACGVTWYALTDEPV
jgi:hypothetical protein